MIKEILTKYKKFIHSSECSELLERKGIFIQDLNRFKCDATKEVTAFCAGSSAIYEDSYYHFIFIFNDEIYGFSWCTPFDEVHRYWGGDIGNQWYDECLGSSKNISFQIFVNPKHPSQFYINDENFSGMNSGINFLGKWDMSLQNHAISIKDKQLGTVNYEFDYLRFLRNTKFNLWDYIFGFPKILKSTKERRKNKKKYDKFYNESR